MYEKAASLVAARGYTNVQTLPEGIPGWLRAGYPTSSPKPLPSCRVTRIAPEELQQTLSQVTVVDIRSPSLYGDGRIDGSRLIPLAELSVRCEEIPKGKPLVIVDHGGKQSYIAVRYLFGRGFPEVIQLAGGLGAWKEARLALAE